MDQIEGMTDGRRTPIYSLMIPDKRLALANEVVELNDVGLSPFRLIPISTFPTVQRSV